MPNKFFHFSIGSIPGAILTLLIFFNRRRLYAYSALMRWLYKKQRWWMLYAPYFVMFFGIWAIMPDILLILDFSPKGVIHSHLFNIFFFYPFIEHLEHTLPIQTDRILSWTGEGLCLAIYGGCIIGYIIFIKKLEKIKNKEGGS